VNEQITAAEIAQQITDQLNQLDAIHPGSTHGGLLMFHGGYIHGTGGQWTVHTDQ
jgi:hypothetical protein